MATRTSPSQFPSIQSFFSTTSSPTKSSSSSTSSPTQQTIPLCSALVNGVDDGFTPRELDSPLSSSMFNWTPEFDYKNLDISSVIPGSQHISVGGRIANFYDQTIPSKMPQAAKGCFKVIVKDDSGALTVRLWYGAEKYGLRLGQLVQLWTSHVSDGTTNSFSSSAAPLVVSIFPGRDRHCNFTLLPSTTDNEIDCRLPSGYQEGQPLSNLMSLHNFIEGGHEVAGARILVCVKSIGAKKTVTNKDGNAHVLVNVGIFDEAAPASLTLWDTTVASVDDWKPSFTILLITNASIRSNKNVSLSLSSNTLVDVDPMMPDAQWLRKMAQKMTKRDHVNPACPDERELPFLATGTLQSSQITDKLKARLVFDLETALASPLRVLYTLADVDEFVRSSPQSPFIGFLSVLVLSMHISTLHMRNMLLSAQCCGVPIFANSTVAACKQCERTVTLRLNPRIVGTLIDETGAVAQGKLIWTDKAWTELLGRDADALVRESGELRRALERRICCGRVCLVFGWAGEEVTGERLCVLGVRE
ncbi:MAG: hypothetical protein M1828_007194 [Chrysothrix sp. TS-e1954]|nr:MAG: hypothetical protein M1828_007194 [Chrysothrix sp. TS-e1954]